MKLYLDIRKAKSELGKEKGGKFLRRVVSGKDKDGSPQYRYLRTEAEVAAYERNHKSDKDKEDSKETHEKQKREHKEIEEKTDNKEKKEKQKPSLLVKDKKKVEKSLYVRR